MANVSKKKLLKKLNKIQLAIQIAPLNWLYNDDGDSINSTARLSYCLNNVSELVRLLPDIVRKLSE